MENSYSKLKSKLLMKIRGKVVEAKILHIEETGEVVTHKCPSKMLQVEYYVNGEYFSNKVYAKYIDPMQLGDLQIGKRVKLCYDEEDPNNIFLSDFTYFSKV